MNRLLNISFAVGLTIVGVLLGVYLGWTFNLTILCLISSGVFLFAFVASVFCRERNSDDTNL